MADANANPKPPDDGLPDEFNPDQTIAEWDRTLKRLVERSRLQQALIDNMEQRLERLEGRRMPPIGSA